MIVIAVMAEGVETMKAGIHPEYKDTKVKTAFVPTDYTCSPGAASGDIEVYFIPHESLREHFIKRGIDNKKIVPVCGIPVNKAYFNAPSKVLDEQLKDVHIKLDIEE